MKKPKPTPKSGEIVVGARPAWEMWVEDVEKRYKEYERLIADGYVSAEIVAQKAGWTIDVARKRLARACKASVIAYRPGKSQSIRLYLL